jgi:hypothetical protein
MAAAIGYAINQQKALERFLDNGRLPMTNNISERNLRKVLAAERTRVISAPRIGYRPRFSAPGAG